MRFRFAIATVLAALLACTAVPKAAAAAPTVSNASVLVQVDGAEQFAACQLLAKWTYVACGKGYTKSGGNKDTSSAEYQFAQPMCTSAAQMTGEMCMAGALASYVGKSGKGECFDLAAIHTDSISLACALSTDDPRRLKKCDIWAAAGAAEFVTWCQAESSKRLPQPKPKKPKNTDI